MNTMNTDTSNQGEMREPEEGTPSTLPKDKRTKPNKVDTLEKVEVIKVEGTLDDTGVEDGDQLRTKNKKKEFLGNLARMMFDITSSCDATHIGRTTFYEWMKKDQAFNRAVMQVEHENVDAIESVVMQQIRKGDGNLAFKALQALSPKYKPTLKTEIVTGHRTLEDIIDEDAARSWAIANGKDPEEVLNTDPDYIGDGQPT